MNFALFCEFGCFSKGKQARFTSRTFVPECPCEKFMNWPFFGLVCRGRSWVLEGFWVSLTGALESQVQKDQNCRCIKQIISNNFESCNYPKDPTVLKTLWHSELLRRSVFTTPPGFTTLWTPLWVENACKTQEYCVSTEGVAIANHCAIVNSLRVVNSLRRSIFSTAGSFGYHPHGCNIFFAMLPPLVCPWLQENMRRNLLCKEIDWCIFYKMSCAKTINFEKYFCNSFGRDGNGLEKEW